MSKIPVLVTYSNNGFIDFAKNLIISLDRTVKHHKLRFYCLNDEIYNELQTFSVKNITLELILWKQDVTERFESYRSPGYKKITHTKANILKDALSLYDFIHFIDCDVVCVKEPTEEHYDKYKDYDIVYQSEWAGTSYTKGRIHLHQIWACTGNTSYRRNERTLAFIDKLIEYEKNNPHLTEQTCQQLIFKDSNIGDIREYPDAKLFTYEVDEYTNGNWINKNVGDLSNTYFFHANWVTNSESKKNLLKKVNMWFV